MRNLESVVARLAHFPDFDSIVRVDSIVGVDPTFVKHSVAKIQHQLTQGFIASLSCSRPLSGEPKLSCDSLGLYTLYKLLTADDLLTDTTLNALVSQFEAPNYYQSLFQWLKEPRTIFHDVPMKRKLKSCEQIIINPCSGFTSQSDEREIPAFFEFVIYYSIYNVLSVIALLPDHYFSEFDKMVIDHFKRSAPELKTMVEKGLDYLQQHPEKYHILLCGLKTSSYKDSSSYYHRRPNSDICSSCISLNLIVSFITFLISDVSKIAHIMAPLSAIGAGGMCCLRQMVIAADYVDNINRVTPVPIIKHRTQSLVDRLRQSIGLSAEPSAASESTPLLAPSDGLITQQPRASALPVVPIASTRGRAITRCPTCAQVWMIRSRIPYLITQEKIQFVSGESRCYLCNMQHYSRDLAQRAATQLTFNAKVDFMVREIKQSFVLYEVQNTEFQQRLRNILVQYGLESDFIVKWMQIHQDGLQRAYILQKELAQHNIASFFTAQRIEAILFQIIAKVIYTRAGHEHYKHFKLTRTRERVAKDIATLSVIGGDHFNTHDCLSGSSSIFESTRDQSSLSFLIDAVSGWQSKKRDFRGLLKSQITEFAAQYPMLSVNYAELFACFDRLLHYCSHSLSISLQSLPELVIIDPAIFGSTVIKCKARGANPNIFMDYQSLVNSIKAGREYQVRILAPNHQGVLNNKMLRFIPEQLKPHIEKFKADVNQFITVKR